MMTTKVQPGWEQKINHAFSWGFRHWLLIINGLVLLYVGMPWLVPLARVAGHHQLADLIFLLYSRLCHQKPEQSFFLYGYQVAFCERDTAMYTSLFVGGLGFGLLRDWIKPISIRSGLLLLVPMLIDGGTQLIDDLVGNPILRGTYDEIGSFNFWMRMITGVLFAVAVLLAVYPRFERDLRQPNLIPA